MNTETVSSNHAENGMILENVSSVIPDMDLGLKHRTASVCSTVNILMKRSSQVSAELHVLMDFISLGLDLQMILPHLNAHLVWYLDANTVLVKDNVLTVIHLELRDMTQVVC